MTDLERAIVDTVARMARERLTPKVIYLVPEDFAELGRYEVGGYPVRESKGKTPSSVYSSHGSRRRVLREARP